MIGRIHVRLAELLLVFWAILVVLFHRFASEERVRAAAQQVKGRQSVEQHLTQLFKG